MLAFDCGLVDVGLHVLRDIRSSYDGTRRSPWNEIECGDHYTRPMAAFLLFEVASGQTWDATRRALGFAPALFNDAATGKFHGFFSNGASWGTYEQAPAAPDAGGGGGGGGGGGAVATASLAVAYGTCELESLTLGSVGKAATVTVSVGGKNVPCTVSAVDGGVELVFAGEGGGATCTVAAGSTLEVALFA